MLRTIPFAVWAPPAAWLLALALAIGGRALGMESFASTATWAASALTLLLPAYLVAFALLRGRSARSRSFRAAMASLGIYAATWAIPTSSGFFGAWPLGFALLLQTGDATWAIAGKVASWRLPRIELPHFPARDGAPPTAACQPVVCERFCPHGFERDANGCEVCACSPPRPRCEPMACKLACEYGFRRDETGCAVCACNEPEGLLTR